uniref:Putative secreted protein n=1 Tax=Panstrongylus lignarius TaxID=156445 RepID=A0A224Y644_9HEMI
MAFFKLSLYSVCFIINLCKCFATYSAIVIPPCPSNIPTNIVPVSSLGKVRCRQLVSSMVSRHPCIDDIHTVH